MASSKSAFPNVNDYPEFLHNAIQKGNLAELAASLKLYKPSIYLRNKDLDTPLMTAVQYRDPELYKDKKPDAKNTMDQKKTDNVQSRRDCLNAILQYEPKQRYPLLKKELTPEAQKDYDNAALKAAEFECIYYLDWYFNELHQKDKLIKLKELFKHDKSIVFHPKVNKRYLTLKFILSIVQNDENINDEIFKIFLPIHHAAMNGDKELMDILLTYKRNSKDKARVNLNEVSTTGLTALTCVLEFYLAGLNLKEAQNIIQTLLAAGAQWSDADLKYAILHEDENLILLKFLEDYKLLDNKNCISIKSEAFHYITEGILSYAIKQGKKSSIKYLLDKNIIDKEWNLPNKPNRKLPDCFYTAAEYGSIDVLKMVLLAGVKYIVSIPDLISCLIGSLNSNKDKKVNLNYLTAIQAYFFDEKDDLIGEKREAVTKDLNYDDFIILCQAIQNEKNRIKQMSDEKIAKSKDARESIRLRLFEGSRPVAAPVVNGILPSAPVAQIEGSPCDVNEQNTASTAATIVGTLAPCRLFTSSSDAKSVDEKKKLLFTQLEIVQNKGINDIYKDNEPLRQQIIDHVLKQISSLQSNGFVFSN